MGLWAILGSAAPEQIRCSKELGAALNDREKERGVSVCEGTVDVGRCSSTNHILLYIRVFIPGGNCIGAAIVGNPSL